MQKLLIESIADDNNINLQNCLKSAFVFNLSFENKIKLLQKKEDIILYAIDIQMLFKLMKQ